VAKPEGKRLIEKPIRRWEDSIKTDLKEIRWSGMGWILLAHGKEPQ
jgi:hypothetical protein